MKWSEENTKIDFQCQVSYVPDDFNVDEDNLDDDLEFDDLNDFSDLDSNDISNAEESDENDFGLKQNLHTLSGMTGELMLKDYSKNGLENDFLDEKSIFCVVKDSSGKTKLIRKSTICWSLMKDKYSLSSDRLTRVKACTFNEIKRSRAIKS